ncbi:MAG: ribonuclease H-like domain-containing protein [Natronomonas sp.]|nr:ribonuclease H-like domain-containing protein [Natronomonas sp.]
MSGHESYAVVVLEASRVNRLDSHEIEDLIDYFHPDGVVLIRGNAPAFTVEQVRYELERVIPDGVGLHAIAESDPRTVTTDAGTVLIAPNELSTQQVESYLPGDGSHTYVLTEAVSVEIDMIALTASVDGLDPYGGHDTPLTVFSGQLASDYWVDHDGIDLRGLGVVKQGNVKIPCFYLGSDGVVTVKSLAEGKLGIRALTGMGETYAVRFKQAGYKTVEDIYRAEMVDLLSIKGVSDHRAEQFTKQSTALVEREVVRFTDDESLPQDVVHIDIETDGLNPSIIWQIGLYDPHADETCAFLQKDSTQKGEILREFGAWLRNNLDGRAVVAYNGWKFDFPHLTEFFHQCAPEYSQTWESTYKVDPYDWVVRERHAAFPSRGNGIEAVADAVGYEREHTGLDGATTAHAYQRWMRNPCEETELDWDRHTTYCREDVLALHHVYQALLNSGRVLSEQNTDRPTDENTQQGTLFDY